MNGRDYRTDYFSVSMFIRNDKRPSKSTIKKIIKWIDTIEQLRNIINMPIFIINGSNTLGYELKHGRNGKGQHIYANGGGAVDIHCLNMKRLVSNITNVNTVCYFKHSDTLHLDNKQRKHKYYLYDYSDKIWKPSSKQLIIKSINE